MKAFYIAQSNLKDFFRNFKSNAIVFILPIVFMSVFGLVFGRSADSISINIGVEEEFYDNSELIKTIEKISSEDDSNLINVHKKEDQEEIQRLIKSGDLDIGIQLVNEQIILTTDPTNQAANAGIGMIASILNPNPQNFLIENIEIESDNDTIFQYLAPGLIVYGILVMIPQVAGELARIKEKNYIFRYFTSKTKSRDILLGFLISQTVLGIIQTLILIYTSVMVGFETSGNILPAFLFTIPLNLLVVGIGLLIGSFASKGDAGQNLGTVVSIILGFLSGSFVAGIDQIMIGNYSITDFIPTFYATDGIQKLFLYGDPISSVATEIAVISVSGVIFVLLGIFVYSKTQLQRIN